MTLNALCRCCGVDRLIHPAETEFGRETARGLAPSHELKPSPAAAIPGLIAGTTDKMVSALDKIAIGDFDQAIDEYQSACEKTRDLLLP